ncbi:hypothetical protein [Paenibacillus polymyxa]|uniref:hypothetical protein n=1 Tax=Paenibacillus polymyxa TaxID=1406 RepID=UPI0002FECF7C|nr:hypothetical protein [Paenibacillus polymyxa]NMP07614.1 hypothetical protein [Paenibacillus polymyxa]
MYYSISKDSKYYVTVTDGIMDVPLMELPSKELADEVAYQLQLAWNEGNSWGRTEMRRQLDPEGFGKETAERLQKFKTMNEMDKKNYSDQIIKQYKTKQQQIRRQISRWNK